MEAAKAKHENKPPNFSGRGFSSRDERLQFPAGLVGDPSLCVGHWSGEVAILSGQRLPPASCHPVSSLCRKLGGGEM